MLRLCAAEHSGKTDEPNEHDKYDERSTHSPKLSYTNYICHSVLLRSSSYLLCNSSILRVSY